VRSLELIRAIEERGGHLSATEDGRIRVAPKSILTDALRAELRRCRDGVIALLNVRQVFPDARVVAVVDPVAAPTAVTAITPISAGQSDQIDDTRDWRGEYEERAAVLEFEAALPRAQAEERAFIEIAVSWCMAHPELDARPSLEAEPIAVVALAEMGVFDPREKALPAVEAMAA